MIYKYKKLSYFLMHFNCLFGLAMFASFFTNWYLFPIGLSLFILNMWFFNKTHKIDFMRMDIESRNMQKTHNWLGYGDEFRDFDVWQNKVTGEIIEK